MTASRKAFRFRTCHLEILEADDSRRFFRPCLLYPIHQCTAPCAAKISKEAYAEDIRRLIQFLDGNKKSVIKSLEKEMLELSTNMQFERAARLRDEIKALQSLSERGRKGDQEYWQPESFVQNPREGVLELQSALGMTEAPRIVEGIDIAHLQGGEMVGSKVCFIDGVPFKDCYRRYKIKHGQGNNDYLSIQEVVSRRYREAGTSHELFPDVILIDGGLGQLHAAMDVFKTMDVKPPMVISLAKKEELIFVQARSEPIRLARNHQGLKLLQYIRDEAHRFAQHYHHILRRKSQLEEDVKGGRRPPATRKARRARQRPDSPDAPVSSDETAETPPVLDAPDSVSESLAPSQQDASHSSD